MTDQNGNRKRKGEASSMLDGLFGASPELPSEEKRVCQECGRLYYDGFDTLDDWLIGRVRAPGWAEKRNTPWVVRCPRHITEWTMRLVGRGRSQFQKQLAADALERDMGKPIPENPFLQPYPHRQTWTD